MSNPAKTSKWRKRLTRLLAVTGVAACLWLVLSYAAVYRLTRRAGPVRPEPVPDLTWGQPSPTRLTTADGQELGAWFIEGRTDRPVVLLLHGNGGCRSACLGEAELASGAGCPVLTVTHRAHGDSTGEVNDFGFSGRHDVVAAVDWVGGRFPGRPVVVWGQSLGSAAAVFAAADLGDRVSGYILECPYQDLRTATRNRTRHYLPWGVEWVAYQGLSVAASVVLPHPDEISPLTAAARMPRAARVLVLAGGADRRATPAEAAAIVEALGDRAKLIVIDGGDHLGLAAADPVGYRAAILDFLKDRSTPAN